MKKQSGENAVYASRVVSLAHIHRGSVSQLSVHFKRTKLKNVFKLFHCFLCKLCSCCEIYRIYEAINQQMYFIHLQNLFEELKKRGF